MAKPRKYGMPQSWKAAKADQHWQRQQARKRAKEHIDMVPIQMAVCGGSDSGCLRDIVNAGVKRK